ncbi:MAG: L,D-transpeptidase [Chloroflexi bacterium]|nr:L,D-transpeptidase [Chloroflexota bacterium]
MTARGWMRCAGLVLLLALTLSPLPVVVRAAPPALPEALYVEATGQTVRGAFLRAWADTGHSRLLGLPITGEVVTGGQVVQYFERARLERNSDDRGVGVGQVTLGRVGWEALGDRWLPARGPAASTGEGPERRYFAATGHSLAFAFKRFWEVNGGLPVFGAPLTEEYDQGGQTVQYFERARFEYVRERAGQPGEVVLGDVGGEVALARALSLAPSPRPVGATDWSPAIEALLVARQQDAQRAAALAAVRAIDPFQVQVAVPIATTFWAPATTAGDAGPIYRGHIFLIDGQVTGETVGGDDRWYRLAIDGSFVPAAHVMPFTPLPPPRTWAGRWVDINLSTFILTVYEGEQPLRSALIIAGRKDRTPTGVFTIFKRVRSEVMDSSTVGFPPGHPEYYLIKDVAYTQYFTGAGHAIHGNYWVHPSRFGQFLSNGCVGLRNNDAAWVWQLTSNGAVVHIHY